MIRNVIMDMGNVLLDYNPDIPLDAFCPDQESKDIIMRELFLGPEWAMADRGEIRDGDRYEMVRPRVPEKYHEALKNCVYSWDICMKPLPGAHEFCEYVRERGLGLYVLSNASDKFYDYFPNFAPFSYFDGILVSADVHLLKPDTRIYELFLTKFSLSASECLFIDDRLNNVEGARKAGILATQFLGNFEELKTLI